MLKRFTGFCIDIVNELAKPSYMNFNFTIEIEDGSGSRNVNTSRWSGIIGKLIEQVMAHVRVVAVYTCNDVTFVGIFIDC